MRVCIKVVTFAVVRVGVPSWCTCGGCVPETFVKKQACAVSGLLKSAGVLLKLSR